MGNSAEQAKRNRTRGRSGEVVGSGPSRSAPDAAHPWQILSPTVRAVCPAWCRVRTHPRTPGRPRKYDLRLARSGGVMPKFNANLSMMFNEVDFPDRFAAAAKAGFKG